MWHDRGRHWRLARLGWLLSETAAGADLPDGSDDLLKVLLGRDLGNATFRLVVYGAIAAAILAAIIVVVT